MTARLVGNGAAPGIATGPPFVVDPPVVDVVDPGSVGPPPAEKARLRAALAQAATELHALAERMRGAAAAAFGAFREMLASSSSDYLAARAADLETSAHASWPSSPAPVAPTTCPTRRPCCWRVS